MEAASRPKAGRAEAFVNFVIRRVQEDPAFGAALRRADNPATEYQSWEYLASWCDLDKARDRIPFVTIGAALARAKPEKDGHMGIGRSLAACYEDGQNSSPAKVRLRRLLACESVEEACRILRPILSLVRSKESQLNYSVLLNDLLFFGETKRLKWATEFYGRRQYDSDDAKA
jgi:CRISPR system Cascade subunit CasB